MRGGDAADRIGTIADRVRSLAEQLDAPRFSEQFEGEDAAAHAVLIEALAHQAEKLSALEHEILDACRAIRVEAEVIA